MTDTVQFVIDDGPHKAEIQSALNDLQSTPEYQEQVSNIRQHCGDSIAVVSGEIPSSAPGDGERGLAFYDRQTNTLYIDVEALKGIQYRTKLEIGQEYEEYLQTASDGERCCL